MKEVTKEFFYSQIGPRDIILNTIGDFPYTTEYKTRSGLLVGKSVDYFKEGKRHPILNKKYIDTEKINSVPIIK